MISRISSVLIVIISVTMSVLMSISSIVLTATLLAIVLTATLLAQLSDCTTTIGVTRTVTLDRLLAYWDSP